MYIIHKSLGQLRRPSGADTRATIVKSRYKDKVSCSEITKDNRISVQTCNGDASLADQILVQLYIQVSTFYPTGSTKFFQNQTTIASACVVYQCETEGGLI